MANKTLDDLLCALEHIDELRSGKRIEWPDTHTWQQVRRVSADKVEAEISAWPGVAKVRTVLAAMGKPLDFSTLRQICARAALSRATTLDAMRRETIGTVAEFMVPEFMVPESDEKDLGPEERALALLVKHPEWSDSRIAKTIKVSRQTLYKPTWSRYQAARQALKSGKANIPHGSKDKGGNLEAWTGDTFGDSDD